MARAKVIKLPITTPPPDAAARAREETERLNALYVWGDKVLADLGIAAAIGRARSPEELSRITLDVNSAEVTLAIRAALHPAIGHRQKCFDGLNQGMLKGILKSRLAEMKKSWKARRGKEPDWTEDLILKASGEIVANLANVILILQKSPDWKGVIGYDEFNAAVVIRKRPPWGHEAPDTRWSDQHESLTRVWFQKDCAINPSLGDVGRAVQAAARTNCFHPVRDYFNSLAWDGTPRLDHWPITYFHAVDTPYIRAVAPRYMISAVARVFDPGCQVDHMLVLEGPQGKLKSQALRTLAVNDGWFTDRLSHVASKDAMLEIAGVMIIEIAEMDALTKASASAIKSFLTRRKDRFRPPYGKHQVNLQRQCVFAGTINPESGGYLKDPTGARRFWPVTCNGMIDREGLADHRDQLWAEAVHRYKAGAPWWLETPELEALATAEQEARFVVDAWEDTVRAWIGNRLSVGLADVIEGALGIEPAQQTQAVQKRVKAILTKMKFTKSRPRLRSGKRKQLYQRDPPLKKEQVK
jgi:putative DNA primase/helicase